MLDCSGISFAGVPSVRLRKLSLKFNDFEAGKIIIQNVPNVSIIYMNISTLIIFDYILENTL
jgi:hypothetical protein